MIAFIDEHRAVHGVEPICKVLPIAPSTYHARVAGRADPSKLSARARRDLALHGEVRRVTPPCRGYWATERRKAHRLGAMGLVFGCGGRI